MQHKVIDAKDVVIRFAGDSGDGMQLTGTLFANLSAIYGNGLSTFPDYPAEIRAPKGTVAGVDDIGSLLVDWDNGSGLNVIWGVDVVRKVVDGDD